MIKQVGQIIDPETDEFLKMWKTFVDPATRMWQDHRHGNFEIAMVLSGFGKYRTVAGLMPIEPGDVFVFPGNEPHWIQEILQGGLQIINLHFNSRMFDARCSISKKYSNLFFSHSDSFGTRIPAKNAGSVRSLIEKIKCELEDTRAEYECYVYGLLDLLFCELIRGHGYYLPKDGVHTAMERIRSSLHYIDIHFTEDITLEEIAMQSGLSPHYFTRLFRECFRMKLWDYVLSRRIDAAKRLLTGENDLTVLQIALNCGFHNTANFNRAFIRFTGVTPREYRKGGTIH